jgi:ectoine hydroxylase-related dioxygenase (phytanoyl-CoA dioxygenase family)
MLTAEQRAFFETFGFLVRRQLFSAHEMAAISQEFNAALAQDRQGRPFDGQKRQVVMGLIEKRPMLRPLIDDDRIYEPIAQLLGAGFVWIGSDSNLYVGDTGWHPDAGTPDYRLIKVALYLDPVANDTGCLRVIPGSHQPPLHDNLWGLLHEGPEGRPPLYRGDPRDVPCYPLESQPGDVVFFNQALWHASFGGTTGRRMFTLNFAQQPTSDEHITFLQDTYKCNLTTAREGQYTPADELYGAAFLGSGRPRIEGMVAKLVELGFK